MPNWPEVADKVINATPPDLLVDWKLMWRDPQPKWTSPAGHLIQLGDSAHTFLPSSGNGGTQALEDAVSLAACLRMAGKDGVATTYFDLSEYLSSRHLGLQIANCGTLKGPRVKSRHIVRLADG